MKGPLHTLLRQLRKENRFSQQTLSEYLAKDGYSIDQARLSRIEAGSRPFWDEVAAIIDTMKLSDREILRLHRASLKRYEPEIGRS